MATTKPKKSVLQWNTNDFPEVILLAWRAFDHASRAHMNATSSQTEHLPQDRRTQLSCDTRFSEKEALNALEGACKAFGINPRKACYRLEQLQPRDD